MHYGLLITHFRSSFKSGVSVHQVVVDFASQAIADETFTILVQNSRKPSVYYERTVEKLYQAS